MREMASGYNNFRWIFYSGRIRGNGVHCLLFMQLKSHIHATFVHGCTERSTNRCCRGKVAVSTHYNTGLQAQVIHFFPNPKPAMYNICSLKGIKNDYDSVLYFVFLYRHYSKCLTKMFKCREM